MEHCIFQIGYRINISKCLNFSFDFWQFFKKGEEKYLCNINKKETLETRNEKDD